MLCGSIFTNDACQAAKDIEASEEALADLFERIENFFKRLESYTEVPPTEAMSDINVKILVEVLNLFAIATKEMKQGRASAYYLRIINMGSSMYRKIPQETGRKAGYRRRVKEIRQINARGGSHGGRTDPETHA